MDPYNYDIAALICVCAVYSNCSSVCVWGGGGGGGGVIKWMFDPDLKGDQAV